MCASKSARKTVHSDTARARVTLQIAKAAQISAIICLTETGSLARLLAKSEGQFRLIAATANSKTHDTLSKEGIEVIRLPVRAIDKYRQVRHALSVAVKSTKVSVGDVVVCAIGSAVYTHQGNLVVLTEVEPSVEDMAITDLLKLTDGIRPQALQAALTIACRIGRAARRGKRIGTIFMLGDSVRVLEGAKQLIPNPFKGHDPTARRLTNPSVGDALVELSKLDGAFVIRGDGFIQTAGTFLATTDVDVKLPVGLGARHAAAAAVTARTVATAVVVSATDGNVRVFSAGSMVLQMDPEVAYGPVDLDNDLSENPPNS